MMMINYCHEKKNMSKRRSKYLPVIKSTIGLFFRSRESIAIRFMHQQEDELEFISPWLNGIYKKLSCLMVPHRFTTKLATPCGFIQQWSFKRKEMEKNEKTNTINKKHTFFFLSLFLNLTLLVAQCLQTQQTTRLKEFVRRVTVTVKKKILPLKFVYLETQPQPSDLNFVSSSKIKKYSVGIGGFLPR